MIISRGGRAVAGFALGVVGDPYAQAASDLADMQETAKYATAQAGAGDLDGAVKQYQTAGANGVAVLGPEIDAVGAPQTKQHTQHAAMLNDKLATIAKAAPATVNDAADAQGILSSMIDDYLMAIQVGRAAQDVSAPKRASMWPVVIVPAAVGGLLILVRRKYESHGSHSARR